VFCRSCPPISHGGASALAGSAAQTEIATPRASAAATPANRRMVTAVSNRGNDAHDPHQATFDPVFHCVVFQPPPTAAPKDGARPERTLRVTGRELADWPPVGSPVGTALVARREHRFAIYAGNPPPRCCGDSGPIKRRPLLRRSALVRTDGRPFRCHRPD